MTDIDAAIEDIGPLEIHVRTIPHGNCREDWKLRSRSSASHNSLHPTLGFEPFSFISGEYAGLNHCSIALL